MLSYQLLSEGLFSANLKVLCVELQGSGEGCYFGEQGLAGGVQALEVGLHRLEVVLHPPLRLGQHLSLLAQQLQAAVLRGRETVGTRYGLQLAWGCLVCTKSCLSAL